MTVFGVSVWWPVGAVTLALFGALGWAWLREEWAPRRPHRRLDESWPKDLADGGRIDRQQREAVLAGESAIEDPAVLKSIERARRSGRLRRRGQR